MPSYHVLVDMFAAGSVSTGIVYLWDMHKFTWLPPGVSYDAFPISSLPKFIFADMFRIVLWQGMDYIVPR